MTTTYIGGIYEKKVGPSSTVVTKYYAALGRRVAMRTRDAAMQGPAGTLTYLLADHLGSTVGLLDASGALVTGSRTSYWPYGSTRTGGSSLPDKAFTGQQKEASDDQLGLYDYGARFYSTVAGRFLSADPVVGRASDPQAWNAYTYVRSNPLRLTDPTGRCWEGQCPGEQDDCSATCHAWRELDRLGIHSQSDLDRYQDEQRKAQNWVNSGSIAEGGGADCDYGCQLRALARAFAGCSACASVDWGAWRHFMEAAANYDLAQAMIAGAALAAAGLMTPDPTSPNAQGEGGPYGFGPCDPSDYKCLYGGGNGYEVSSLECAMAGESHVKGACSAEDTIQHDHTDGFERALTDPLPDVDTRATIIYYRRQHKRGEPSRSRLTSLYRLRSLVPLAHRAIGSRLTSPCLLDGELSLEETVWARPPTAARNHLQTPPHSRTFRGGVSSFIVAGTAGAVAVLTAGQAAPVGLPVGTFALGAASAASWVSVGCTGANAVALMAQTLTSRDQSRQFQTDVAKKLLSNVIRLAPRC